MFWRRKSTTKDVPSTTAKRSGGGYIAYYGLGEWWNRTFTPEEQSQIENRYEPFGASGSNTLTTGGVESIGRHSGPPSEAPHFLTGLASWFTRKVDAHIGLRIIARALEGPFQTASDEHFALNTYIEIRYKQRNEDPQAMPDVIAACERMIEIATTVAKEMKAEYGTVAPVHRGFSQLLTIRRKQKDVEAVEELERLHQECWWKYTEEYKRERAQARRLR